MAYVHLCDTYAELIGKTFLQNMLEAEQQQDVQKKKKTFTVLKIP